MRTLFDGSSMSGWRMSTIRNQPGRDDPGRFEIVDGALVARPGSDIGLLWHGEPTPGNFLLHAEWRLDRSDDNSGIFVRFPDIETKGYDNSAWVAAHYGFEVQIDELARPDGNPLQRTGAIYKEAPPDWAGELPPIEAGSWQTFEIRVERQSYWVLLNDRLITAFTYDPSAEERFIGRGLPSTAEDPRFVGLQTHTGNVAFRNIWLREL